MENKSKREKRKSYFRIILTYVILILFFLLLNFEKSEAIFWNDYVSSEITSSGNESKKYEGIALQKVNRGDIVLTTVKLPEEKRMSQAILCFDTYHSVVTVRYGEEELAVYGEDLDSRDFMIGAVYAQVEIPDEAWGEELTVEYHVRENSAFSNLSNYKVYQADRAYRSIYEGQRANLIILMFLIVGSIVGIFVFFLGKGFYFPKEIIYLLLFVIDCSLWIFIYSGLYRLFFEGYTWAVLEYVTLYSLPVMLLFYFYEKDDSNSKYKKSYFALGAAWSLLVVGVTVLNLAGVVHYNEFSFGVQIAMVLSGIYVLATGFTKRAKFGDRLVVTGMVMMVVMWGIEIVRVVLYRYFGATNLSEMYYFPTIGLLGFITYMLMAVYDDMQAKRKQIAEMDQEIRKLEVQVHTTYINGMLSQIQPHFLYNTLSSIRTIIKIDPDRAYDMLYEFTVYLRGSLKLLSAENRISFSEELKNIEAYLNVEKMRLGKRMEIRMDIQDKDFMIPPLTIQPIVENAVKHGIFPKGKQGGYVEVKTFEKDNCHWVTVTDNGVGFDADMIGKKKDAVGLVNLMYRIEHLVNGEIQIDSVIDEGTSITVKIPKEGERGNEQKLENSSSR